ncbi:MAG: transcription antitermination factor NusB [Dehalococcoidia bacterium]
MTERRKARMLALKALFEADIAHHDALAALVRLIGDEQPQPETAAFARFLVQGVLTFHDEIDLQIRQAAPAFPLEQIAAIDRNVLRLALYEILKNNEKPVRAVVNEAVELAKSYGSDGSRRFVNGVLGAITATLHQ